jgi:hypothetical protein
MIPDGDRIYGPLLGADFSPWASEITPEPFVILPRVFRDAEAVDAVQPKSAVEGVSA